MCRGLTYSGQCKLYGFCTCTCAMQVLCNFKLLHPLIPSCFRVDLCSSISALVCTLTHRSLTPALKWWLGVNPSVCLDGNLMAFPLFPGNSLDPLGYHYVTCKRGGDGIMLYMMCSSIISVELACYHMLKLVVTRVRTAKGPVQQTSLSPIGTAASQWPLISLLHLHSILVLLWKWACTLALQQEQLSSGNILKMTQNVLN